MSVPLDAFITCLAGEKDVTIGAAE